MQKHEVVPTDALLGLPDREFSYVLQEWDQSFCIEDCYEESRRKVDKTLGIGQSVRSLEQMNVSMAESVSIFQESAPKPPPAQDGAILVLTADGKGVPMRRDAGQDPPAIRGRRKRRHKKRCLTPLLFPRDNLVQRRLERRGCPPWDDAG